MSHDRSRTWEHAVETVLLLGVAVLTGVAVLPGMKVPGWLLPLVVITAGIVAALSVWSATGRGALSGICAGYGAFLGVWSVWAELTRVWDFAVLAAWIIGMIVFCPAAAHAALARRSTPEKEKAALEAGDARQAAAEAAEREHAEEMSRFEHMFNEVGCAGVQILELTEERSGRVIRLQLPRSGKVTLTTLEGARQAIEIILRLKPGHVEFETGEHSGDIIMRLRERDALTDSPRLRKELRATSINNPFAIGIQEDGNVLKITLRELHLMIIGTTGMGKSNLINVILAQLSSCVDTLIWVIDMKGGRTAKPWLQAWTEGKADAPAIDWVASTREESALMMQAFKDAIETRSTSGIGGSKITPSASMPQIILICDEMAVLFGASRGRRSQVGEEGTTNSQFIGLAEECVQLGRSEAGATVWATQRGTNSMAGSGDVKSLCKLRIALGVATENELRYIIPDARMAQKQLSVMASTPGIGVAAVGRNASKLTKFFHHDHIEGQCSEGGNEGCVAACPVYQMSIEVGSIRPRLDRLTAAPLGEVYAQRWQRAEHLLRRPVPAGGVAVADVDTSTFDEIVRDLDDLVEEKAHPARKRYREILASRGALGATPKYLFDRLTDEDYEIARETLQRWLRGDETQGLVHQAHHGRWRSGPGEGSAAA